MYYKLSYRNAKRSAGDYSLYITTLIILISLMMLANLLIVATESTKGIQSASLSIIITVILAILLGYISKFMLHHRSKEFGVYTLLGMKKSKIANLFFFESLFLSSICFVVGVVLGGILFTFFPFTISFSVMGKASVLTMMYFFCIEILSVFHIRSLIKKMQIINLVSAKKQNEGFKRSALIVWTWVFFISFFIFLVFFIGIFLFPNMAMIFIGTVFTPLILAIVAFYKAFFLHLANFRTKKTSKLYKKNKLYAISRVVSKINTNAHLNAALAVCLVFSCFAFLSVTAINNTPDNIFAEDFKTLMGLMQTSLCIIFMVVYFCIMSIHHVVDVKANINDFKIMSYLGKTQKELNRIILNQICIKFTLPTIPLLTVLTIALLPLNHTLNSILTQSNALLQGLGIFFTCFIALYVCYLLVVYLMSKKPLSLNAKN